jgi:L-amino acid N-acyltransferase YncA
LLGELVGIAPVVRELRAADWPAVSAIYLDGIRSGLASFETEVPSREDWDAAHTIGVVSELDERVIGWAALGPVSKRHCYRGVAESSVYVARDHHGHGIGLALMEELIARSEAAGIWTIQTSIFPENEASLKLHHRVGFRVVGVRKRIARRDGLWRDAVLMERRSEVID